MPRISPRAVSVFIACSVATLALVAPGITFAQSSIPEWRVQPAPDVTIGEQIGERGQFTRIMGLARLADGSIAVASRGSHDIRIFSAAGAFVRAYGRRGAGPGEFESPGVVARSGDTLYLYDHSHERITALDLRSGTVRTHSAPRAPANAIVPMARLASGALLGAPIPVTSMRRPDGLLRYRIDVFIVSSDTTRPPVRLGEFPWLTSLAINPANSERATSVGSYPFGPHLHLAASNDAAVLGDAAEPALQYFDAAGRPVGRATLPLEPRSFDRAVIARLGAAAVADVRDERAKASLRARHDPRYLPSHQPYFRALLPGPDGEVWVERYQEDPATNSEFLVVGSDRTVMARLRTPAGVRVRDVGREHLLGIVTDADGVESVVMYRYQRGRR